MNINYNVAIDSDTALTDEEGEAVTGFLVDLMEESGECSGISDEENITHEQRVRTSRIVLVSARILHDLLLPFLDADRLGQLMVQNNLTEEMYTKYFMSEVIK